MAQHAGWCMGGNMRAQVGQCMQPNMKKTMCSWCAVKKTA